MANTTITNLPASVSLTGAEQLEAVQSGSSVRVTASQIAALAQNTQGTVTQIDTAGALTGGPITTTGTISLPPDAVTNVYLAEMPANTVKANLTGLTANPTDVTPSAVLNTFGSAAGSMLYRGASLWEALSPGTTGQYLSTTGATPQWVTLSVSPGQLTPTGVVPGTYGTASSVPTITVNAGGQLTAASNTLISIPAGQVTGLGTMAIQNANAVAITGGNIDGTAIGSTSASSAAFTTISAGTWNGSPIGIAYGGTGATTAPTARTNLGLGTMATQNASAVAITGGTIDGVSIGGSNPQGGSFTTLNVSGNAAMSTITSGTWNGNAIGVAYGGTGATDATTARTNLSAAKSGANSDITSLSGLTTPLSAPQGGTGFSSYTDGDLLYAVTSSSLGRLNDVATGNVLLSGGVGVAPAYGKVGLTTHVDGILPVANGGTGAATLTGYVKGNGTSAMTASATIPNSDLQNSTIQIGSTSIALGASSSTLAGLTSVTLTQDPTSALQASTKQYVDDQVATVSNLTYHTQVVASTTANLNATYNNGSSGVGATLTNAGAFAVFSIDSTSPTATQRVLIKDQTNAAQNGIYVVTTVGDAISVPWVLTRASDFNAQGSGPNFIQTGASVFVQGGTTWGSTSWVMVTTGTINVGSTNLVWTQTSSSGNILVNAPLAKAGNTISLNTVTVPFGGTGQTSYTIGDLLYADSSSSLAKLADVATGNVLRSGGIGVAPAWGKVDLTTDVTGTLPVGNGGTGTATAFTQGSVLFAGASGVYSQNNANFYWDNVNTRLGIHTASPDATLTVVSETQTALPPGALPAGTDLHIVGANNADARITQDAFGTGNYPAYTGRHARGTAASPTATQSGDILSQYTGRGYGATGYNSSSTGVFQFEAAENFTDTAQGTFASLKLTATGAASPTEVFRIGPSGQVGVGGSSYGTSNQLLTSGGSGAAPSWQSGINVTTIGASGAVTLSTTTDTIAIGTSQTSGLLNIGGASQTGATSIAPSTKTITIGLGAGATESAETKTLNLGTAGVSGSTTAINIGASASGSISTTTLYGTVKVNGLTASKGVFTDASSNFTSTGTLATDQGGTGLTTFSVGDIPYYASGTALSKLSIGSNGQVLTSNGTAPVWTNASSISVSTATNLAGGAAGSIPYQSGASTTTFLSIGTANRVMTSTGTAPQWVTSLTGLTGVSSAGLTNTNLTSGRVVYSTTGGAQTDSANLTYDGTTFTSAGATNLATSTGNVGIGTASPGTLLTVYKASDPEIRVQSSAASSYFGTQSTAYGAIAAKDAKIYSQDGITLMADAATGVIKFATGGSGEKMRLDASGNLGIGTASPQRKLNVVDSSSSTSIGGSTAVLQVGNSNGGSINLTAGIELFGSGAPSSGLGNRSAGLYGVYEAYNASGNAGALVLATNPAGTTSVVERMRIDSSGNVGIGTASPGCKLDINGIAGWSGNTTGIAAQIVNVTSGINGGGNLRVLSNTSATTDAGGSVSLGGYYSTTAASIDFASIIGAKENSTAGNSAGYFAIGTRPNGGNNTERMRIASNGNVGIGTASPSTRLHVVGPSGFGNGAGTSTSFIGITGTGNEATTLGFGTGSGSSFDISLFANGATPANAVYFNNRNSSPMVFLTNNTERMRIDSSGNVGIGTASPNRFVHLYSTDNWMNFQNASRSYLIGVGTTSNFSIYDNTGGTERLTVTSAGNVGIGTASPTFKLVAANSATDGGWIYSTGAVSVLGLGGYANAGDGAFQIRYDRTTGGITFNGGSRDTPAARMTIDNSGNVGIGTASPSSKLDVSGTVTISNTSLGTTQGNTKEWQTLFTTTSNGDYIKSFAVRTSNGTDWTTAGLRLQRQVDVTWQAYMQFGGGNNEGISFGTGGSTVGPLSITERMRIDNNGNVGIGTASPGYKLEVSGGDVRTNTTSFLYANTLRLRGSDSFQIYESAASTNLSISTASGAIVIAPNTTERARISTAGGFSVGTTADPGAGAIYATGNITAYYSDARLKDFKGRIGGALDKVSQLNGYYYTENAKAEEYGYNNKATQVGVSAQEVQAVLPEVVSAAPFDLDENGESKSGENYMTVNYEKLVPLLIEAIKELTAKVEALEGKK